MKETMPADLLDAGFDVARRYHSFGSYGSIFKACKALQRRYPGLSAEEYEAIFLSNLHLLNIAEDLLAINADNLWQEYKTTGHIQFSAFDEDIQRRCPDMPLSVGYEACFWVWYWYHLR